MSSRVGRWWSNTGWARRRTAINITIVVVILLFCLWKAIYP
jgi:hypothetical protein